MENWTEKKNKLRLKFVILRDSDLDIVEGHNEEMIAKLQIKLGKTKEELIKIIAGL